MHYSTASCATLHNDGYSRVFGGIYQTRLALPARSSRHWACHSARRLATVAQGRRRAPGTLQGISVGFARRSIHCRDISGSPAPSAGHASATFLGRFAKIRRSPQSRIHHGGQAER